MITIGNIEDILFNDMNFFGIATYKKDAITEGKVTEERIVILPGKMRSGTYWSKTFVDVNLCIPDIKIGNVLMADKLRLAHFERLCSDVESVGEYDNTHYSYSVYSVGQESDPELGCHYVNIKLLFKILNVK